MGFGTIRKGKSSLYDPSGGKPVPEGKPGDLAEFSRKLNEALQKPPGTQQSSARSFQSCQPRV